MDERIAYFSDLHLVHSTYIYRRTGMYLSKSCTVLCTNNASVFMKVSGMLLYPYGLLHDIDKESLCAGLYTSYACYKPNLRHIFRFLAFCLQSVQVQMCLKG